MNDKQLKRHILRTMRKFILLAALCCATGSIFGQTDPNQLKKEGNDALNAKNYQVAFTKYK